MFPKNGFFDKINNAFFSVIDVFLVLLEERGWNIPEETRFLYHTAIFIFLLWLGLPLIMVYFLEFEIFVLVLAVASFCIANIMPIRKLLGYYSTEEKINGIVSKIKNNQISIKAVAKHLNKNLLPPNQTLSIIMAYRAKGTGLPPELIRAIIRQPQEITVFKEIIKEQLNESDFSLLMRKYRDRIPKELLLKTVASQKMDAITVRDLLFFQENAYQIINEIGKKADNAELMEFVIAEKHRYKSIMRSKNFLRNHHPTISVLIALAFALAPVPFIQDQTMLAAGSVIVWLIVFEIFYNFELREIYFRI